MSFQELGHVRAHGHDPFPGVPYVGERFLDQPGGQALSGDGFVDLGVVEDALFPAVTVGGQPGALAVDQDFVAVLRVYAPDDGATKNWLIGCPFG